MTPAGFRASLAEHAPPKGAAAPLVALWWIKKGDWDRAHEIVMRENSQQAAWVHAHLHRIEGDISNAGYWYRQAKKPEASGAIEAEWDAIVDGILAP
jgi:hypothetical protein